jgi:hypothetical protein
MNLKVKKTGYRLSEQQGMWGLLNSFHIQQSPHPHVEA